jgi:hypothetical protein
VATAVPVPKPVTQIKRLTGLLSMAFGIREQAASRLQEPDYRFARSCILGTATSCLSPTVV